MDGRAERYVAFLTIRGNGTRCFLSELRGPLPVSESGPPPIQSPTHPTTGPSDSVSPVARSAAGQPARCSQAEAALFFFLLSSSTATKATLPICSAAGCCVLLEGGRLQHAVSDHFPVWLVCKFYGLSSLGWEGGREEGDNLRGVIYCSKLFRGS